MGTRNIPACFLGLLLLGVGLVAGCRKDKGNDLVFGHTAIYMPQALQSGGINLTYQVPSGLDTATRNYVIEPGGKTLDVILGVSRSGMQAPEGFSVDVSADPDTIAAAIQSGVLQAVSLPEKSYVLPQSVSVSSGQTEATFYLQVNIDQLKQFAGQKVALAVKVTNPSRYTLNTDFCETIVVIDVDALNL
jgi:hypothetical protein